MQKELRVFGLFFTLVLVTSCNTETHSNPVLEEDKEVTEVESTVFEESVLTDDELHAKVMGSWSSNAQPGQVDFNEDGTYKNCEFFNSTADDVENESCLEGTWSVDHDKIVIIYPEGDTVSNSVTWVFDNVIYLGHDNEEIDQELAWEYGITKL